jgi:hypothetical protein
LGDDDTLALLGQGIVDAYAAGGESAKVFANDSEIEKEYFSPVLVQTNLARRSLCHAVERLGELMVVIPAEKLLSASAKEWATAELQDGAADDASPEKRLDFVHDVLDRFEAVRTETAKLRNFCSRMMRIHSLAHHTTGAGWNTVAQLCFRENWDRKQVQIQDGFVPLSSWDDKIAAAMRRCKPEKHLTKEGALLGPACPRIRLPSSSHHQRSASRSPTAPHGAGGRAGAGDAGAGDAAAEAAGAAADGIQSVSGKRQGLD